MRNPSRLCFSSGSAPPSERGAHLARRLLLHQLDAWGVPHGSEASDTAALLVAEVAANAAPHGRVPAGTSRSPPRSSAGPSSRALPRPYVLIRRRARSVASSVRVVQAGREVVDVVLESGVAGAWGGFPETVLRSYEKAARVMVRVGRTTFGQGGPSTSGRGHRYPAAWRWRCRSRRGRTPRESPGPPPWVGSWVA